MSAPEALGTYDPNSVICSLGNFPLGGWGVDAMIDYEPPGPRVTVKYGIGGDAVVSRDPAAIRHVLVTLTFLPTSRSYRRVAELAESQLVGAVAPMPYMMRDTITGDQYASDQVVFVEVPDASKGKEANDMAFKLLLVDCRRERGTLNL